MYIIYIMDSEMNEDKYNVQLIWQIQRAIYS
jgi:hypothetical protein